MRAARALALIGLAACGQDRIALLAPAGWQSALLSIESGSGRTLRAESHRDPLEIELSDPGDVELVALFYDAPLARLAMLEGPFEPGDRAAPSGELGAFARARRDGAVSPLEVLDARDPRREHIRLPNITPPLCAALARCFRVDESNRSCVDDCAAPLIDPPRPPVPPTLPVLTPCPSAWPTDGDECRPPPLPTATPCADGERQATGGQGCAPLGAPCPQGIWPDPAPLDARFVDPARRPAPSGDASYATIAEALAAPGSRAVIVLSRGVHMLDAAIEVPTIVGACVAGTVLELGGPALSGGRLEQLTLRSVDASPVLDVPEGRSATIARAAIRGGAVWSRGQLRLEDVSIRDVLSARAVSVIAGSARLERVAIDHGKPPIVVAEPLAIASLDDVVLSSTASARLTAAGATIHARNVAFVQTHVFASAGGTIELEDVAFSTAALPNAINASEGAHVTVLRGAFGARRRAVLATQAYVGLDDVWIDGTAALEDPTLTAIAGSTLSVDRATIFGSPLQTVAITDASATLRDVRVRESGGRPGGPTQVVRALRARLEIVRMVIARSRGVGLSVSTATAAISDLTIDGITGDSTGETRAVDAAASVLRLERALLHDSPNGAVRVNEGRAELFDIDVERSELLGIQLSSGAHTIERARVKDVEWRAISFGMTTGFGRDLDVSGGSSGVVVSGGSRVALERVRARDTFGQAIEIRESSEAQIRALEVDGVTASGSEPGYGFFILHDTRVELTHARITNAAAALLHVESRADLPPGVAVLRVRATALSRSPKGLVIVHSGGVDPDVELEGVTMIEVDVEREDLTQKP